VTDGTVTQVQGLDAGAVVATTGFDKLQDGSKVTIRGASGGANGQNAPGGGKTGGNTGAPNGKEAGSGKGNGGKKQGGSTQ
jgi:hypothetical protein